MLFVKTISENLNQTDGIDHVQILMQKKGLEQKFFPFLHQAD